ncbi:ADP-ribosylglycohydrolase family protein [Pleomorphomonas sp. JP5]|uniref:ADP-ribosylglycohydrolase family protein n=1 Tax=Pleomorphomonas sp. JP5 TaxID=2942998 RepID=UPI002042E833|nr:ADP-ribosylglycohydrolase family protein [Pleomorphomonas sp. JP5]MCM5556326.1 ADP-ribosylglycohydrolase family protein [Pleomorphomonas sp. JP5]
MNTSAEAIRRVFAAACLGDALGAATEAMHPNDIVAVFGGRVDRLLPPPPKAPFAAGLTPGRLTDDATQMLAMARRIMATHGRPTVDDAVAGMLDWAEDADVFARFAGPTTRIAVEQLKAGADPAAVASPSVYSCMFGTSNGGAMRAPAAGCARPGRPEEAAKLAAVLSAPTHNTQVAFGGAGAVAGAIAAGLGGAEFSDIEEAAVIGARAGEAEAAAWGRVVGGAGVIRRIGMAVHIGRRLAGDVHAASAELTEVIGNGVAMAEAVPHAFGLVVAAQGNTWQAILGAVNGGNDSDTIAMIAGAIAAAYEPAESWPADIVAEIERQNGLDLATFAAEFVASFSPEIV